MNCLQSKLKGQGKALSLSENWKFIFLKMDSLLNELFRSLPAD